MHFLTLGDPCLSCPLHFGGFSCFRMSSPPVWEGRLQTCSVAPGLSGGPCTLSLYCRLFLQLFVQFQSWRLECISPVRRIVVSRDVKIRRDDLFPSRIYLSWDSPVLLSQTWEISMRHFSMSSHTGYTIYCFLRRDVSVKFWYLLLVQIRSLMATAP